MTADHLTVSIFQPEGEVTKMDAAVVSSQNPVGAFDILPNHHSFISIIGHELRITDPSGKKKIISFTQGILRCRENIVDVYLDIAATQLDSLE